MSDIKHDMTPTKRLAKLMAEMHFYYAKELFDRLGPEEGEQAVRAALKHMAEARVAAMQRDADEQGLPQTGKSTYRQIKDFPTVDWERDANGMVSYCPMAETWKTHGEEGVQLGQLYCLIDYDLYDGFGMELIRPECLAKGDACCRFQPRERTK